MFISDSGNESSLKSVFESDGLSGMIFFEHEIKRTGMKSDTRVKNLRTRFDIVCQSKDSISKTALGKFNFKKFVIDSQCMLGFSRLKTVNFLL